MKRGVVVAMSAFACAVATGLVALAAFRNSLSENDEARNATLLEMLGGPALFVWGLLTLLGGMFGCVDSMWALNGADLRRAIPITIMVTVGTAAIASTYFGVLGALAALPVAMVTMRICRWFFPLPSSRVGS